MKKPRFGGDDPAAREQAEREAQEELSRLSRRAGPPPSSFSPSSGPRSLGGSSGPKLPPLREYSPRAEPDDGYDEDELDEYEDDGEWDDRPSRGSAGSKYYESPRSAKEEEELITELALRDWAAGRGAQQFESFALPRIDASSVEMQRDRALREILERQERMKAQYRQQREREAVPGDDTELSDVQSAHQMNVLRRGKPPGMMNMAAAQTGAFIRQRAERERARSRAQDDPEPLRPARTAATAKKAAATKAAATKAAAKATKAKATKAAAKATKAKATKAAATEAATAAPAGGGAKPVKTAKAGKAAKATKAGAGTEATAAKEVPPPAGTSGKAPATAKAKATRKAPARAKATKAPTRAVPAAGKGRAPAPEPEDAGAVAKTAKSVLKKAARSPVGKAAKAVRGAVTDDEAPPEPESGRPITAAERVAQRVAARKAAAAAQKRR